VLSSYSAPRQQQLYYLGVGVSFELRDGVSIDIERSSAIGMSQKILRHFDIRSDCAEQSTQGVAEVVPTYYLAFDSRPL
jgi:hypothetical protein